MTFRSRSTSVPADFGFLGVDIHSHVLPGIDDGAEDVAAATTLIGALGGYGFTTVWGTPHVMREVYETTPAQVAAALSSTRAALGPSPTVHVEAAGEYYLDEGLREALVRGELRCLPERRVLVEWSLLAEPLNVLADLTYLISLDYVPVLAHPERYRYWSRLDTWRSLVDLGCELQVNLISLSNYYGDGARETAVSLLGAGLVTYAGTDCHHLKQASALASVLASRSTMRLLRAADLRNAELTSTPCL